MSVITFNTVARSYTPWSSNGEEKIHKRLTYSTNKSHMLLYSNLTEQPAVSGRVLSHPVPLIGYSTGRQRKGQVRVS